MADGEKWLSARAAADLIKSQFSALDETHETIIQWCAAGLVSCRCRLYQVDGAKSRPGHENCAVTKDFWARFLDPHYRQTQTWEVGNFVATEVIGEGYDLEFTYHRIFGAQFSEAQLREHAGLPSEEADPVSIGLANAKKWGTSNPTPAPAPAPLPAADTRRLTQQEMDAAIIDIMARGPRIADPALTDARIIARYGYATAPAPAPEPKPGAKVPETRPRLSDSNMDKVSRLIVGLFETDATEVFAHRVACAAFPDKHVPREYFLGRFRLIRGHKNRGKTANKQK